jgi:putative FmdB family regulatory protein
MQKQRKNLTMPLYEYECTTCHKHTEKIQKFSDPEITVCPHCGGVLERVVSAPADLLQRWWLVRGRLRQCEA